MGSNAAGDSEGWGNRVEAVPVDCLIPGILQGLAAPTDPWDEIQAADGGRASRLRAIPYAGSTCREWHSLVTPSVEYAALRLAQFQLLQVPRHRRFDNDSFVVDGFDRHMAVFGKSWRVAASLSQHLRTAPLSALADSDLEELRGRLVEGWAPCEVVVAPGSDWRRDSLLWVTPAERS